MSKMNTDECFMDVQIDECNDSCVMGNMESFQGQCLKGDKQNFGAVTANLKCRT